MADAPDPTPADQAPPDTTVDGIPDTAATPDVASSDQAHYEQLLASIADGSSSAAVVVTPDGVPAAPPPAAAESEPATPANAPDIATLRADIMAEFAPQFEALKAWQASQAPPPEPVATAPEPSANPFELLAKHDLGEAAEHVNAFTLSEMTANLAQLNQWTVWSNGSARTPEDKAKAAHHIADISKTLGRLKYDAQRDADTAQIKAHQKTVANALDPVQTRANYTAELGAFFEPAGLPLLAAHAKAGGSLDMCTAGIDFTLARGDEAAEKAIARKIHDRCQLTEQVMASLAPADTPASSARTVTPPKNPALLIPPPATPVVSGEVVAPTTNAEYWKRAQSLITSKSN